MWSSLKVLMALAAVVLVFSLVAENEVSASPIPAPDPEPCGGEEPMPMKEPKKDKGDKKDKEKEFEKKLKKLMDMFM